MKRVLFLGTVMAVILTAIFTVPSLAASSFGQETCQDGGDWVKVDGLSGTSYTYTAPAGYLITGWCYKAATTVIKGDVDPPAGSVTVTSTVQNQNGQVQDLSHASFQLVQDEPEICEETEAIYGTWSDWAVDPGNPAQEYRTRSITYVDANDSSVICGSDTETEYRPRQTCVDSYAVYSEWSEWQFDAASGKEFRTRSVTYVDSVDRTTVCGSDTQTEWREVPPESCQQTTPIYGEWSDWQVDPVSGKEFRTRSVTYVDSVDGTTVCGEDTETDWKDPTNLVPYCFIDHTIWVPTGDNPPAGSTLGECPIPEIKIRWIAKCDICRAVVSIWENIFGDGPEWYDDQLYGSQEERPMAASIVENCINRKSRCDYERWVVVTGREGQPSDFDTLSDGVNFPASQPHLGADGQQWILYMNRVGPPENRYKTVMGERIPFQNSWDGWFVTRDGETLKTWRNWPCCLAASYAMTIQENGVNYAIKFPGMCQWSWVQFFVKIGYYPNPGKDNWDGWQYLFDENLEWYKQLMDPRVPIGERFAFPDAITEIPSQ